MDTSRSSKSGFGPFLKGLDRSRAVISGVYSLGQGPVDLEIQPPGGPVASTHQVALDGSMVASGDMTRVAIGNGPDLAGKTLQISSVISSSDPTPQRVQIRYTLKGGQADRTFETEGVLDASASTFLVRAQIALK